MGRPSLRQVVLLAVCLVPSVASAQLLDMREHARRLDHLSLGLGLSTSLYVGTQDGANTSVVAPSPTFSLRLRDAVVEVAVPIAMLKTNSLLDGNRRKARVGNLWAGVSYLPDRACGLTRLTLGVGAPTARADTDLQAQALALANATQGGWDRYLWQPNLLPLVAGYQTTLPLGRRQLGRLTGEGDVAIGLPGGGRETELGLQWAGEASVGRAIRFGGRLSGAYWPTLESAPFQSALSVFLRYGGRRYWVGGRLVMNLNSPAGFAFGPDGVWGGQLSFAGAL